MSPLDPPIPSANGNGSAKPLIGITMGDPCGIGAEVIVKALADPDLRSLGRFIIYGFDDALHAAAEDAGIRPYWHTIAHNDDRRIESGVMVVDFEPDTAGFWVNSRPTAEGGRASLAFVDEAVQAAAARQIDAVVTGPINKTSWKLAGCRFPGHTDKLADDLKAKRCTMAFVADTSGSGPESATSGPGAKVGLGAKGSSGATAGQGADGGLPASAEHSGAFSGSGATGRMSASAERSGTNGSSSGNVLRVALASAHLGLFQLRNQFTIGRVFQPIDVLNEALRQWFGIERPRIAVLGLNPHAGEDGLLGDEEQRVIEPAIQMARNQGVIVEGPFPADTFFIRENRIRYDGVVAMYHDQGLIPVKMLAFDRAVNVTLGLPIIRTSPDHGTAFDIAGTSQANPGSMKEAIRLACRLAANARAAAPHEAVVQT
jgi:4-hydroxy-L-threonine phosphate dehydrogenase PdxA